MTVSKALVVAAVAVATTAGCQSNVAMPTRSHIASVATHDRPRPTPSQRVGISALPFSLVVNTHQGAISAPVAPLVASVHADGHADPIDPPHATAREWLTAVWIAQSAYPDRPSTGTSYVYGHACHHHACAFTGLRNVRSGDAITVTTTARELSYHVCATGISPKSGDLEVPRCANGAPDLVLVTCEYEGGDVSANNLVVVATSTD
ncbi:sortase domain-bontaining protein [Jatrophihabitans sp.]|uniref:sortase domain-containing protein n=1 Tax=Jatrophihabitans sp. TaxID=1932789 RepID=UPI002F21ECD6